MSAKDISQLYQKTVIQHNRNPQNYGPIENETHRSRGYNPICGDAISVYLKMDNDKIQDFGFEGDCCAICKCSGSMLSKEVMGLTVDQFKQKLTQFENTIKTLPQDDAQWEALGELSVFKGLRDFPSRVSCAHLPWRATLAAIEREAQVSTE